MMLALFYGAYANSTIICMQLIYLCSKADHEHYHPSFLSSHVYKGLIHYNGNREKSFMQRILKKIQQIDSHTHTHSNHTTATTSSANKTMIVGHEAHYCLKRTNDHREQLWCEFAFKTFIIATDRIKHIFLSHRDHSAVLNIQL